MKLQVSSARPKPIRVNVRRRRHLWSERDVSAAKNGQRFAYICPAGGTAGTMWGTDTYTDDSSICTAAVHTGRITLGQGGTVVIEIRAGQSAYVASTRNGLTPGGKSCIANRDCTAALCMGSVCAVAATWSSTATIFRGSNNLRVPYICPSSGMAGAIWGTDTYTDDSLFAPPVCTPAQ